MSDTDYKLAEEFPLDRTAAWQNENRALANKIIKKYNKWQTKHRFDIERGHILLARIELPMKDGSYASENGDSPIIYELFQEMKEFVLLKLSANEND